MVQILVYGASILIEGIASQLVSQSHLQIHRAKSLADLGNLSDFDAVLVDLNDTSASDVLAMLRACPDLRIIGVNAATGSVTLLAGRVYLAQTAEEVISCLTHATTEG